MKIFFRDITLSSRKRLELIDITHQVEEIVRESGVKNGICLVYAPHATAAIIANEHESGLIEDILDKIDEDFPRDGRWRHNRIDDNAAAHIASAFLGTTKVLPIVDGRLLRGVWQNILLVELDGPRADRRVIVKILEG